MTFDICLQVLVFTDCGIGFGTTSLKTTIANLKLLKLKKESLDTACLPFSYSSKLSFVCLGTLNDSYYQHAIKLYQELLDVSNQKGALFLPKKRDDNDFIKKEDNSEPSVSDIQGKIVSEMIIQMCETNYKPFEAVLKCGGYAKLESPIIIWPPPLVRRPNNCLDFFL